MSGQAVITINDNQWAVSLATTSAELVRGLSGVPSMPAGTGMLFILPAKQAVSVDTRDMKFALDIVFISDNTVIDVASNIQPGYLVTEETLCDAFLEVNAGEAAGVEAGDTVSTAIIQEPGFDLSSIISFAIPLATLGFVCAMVGGMATAMAGSSSSPKQLGRSSTQEKAFPYHAVAYGYEGEILETDDFKHPPTKEILRQWATVLSEKEFGKGLGGFGPGQKMSVDKIIVTGPSGYQIKWSRWDLIGEHHSVEEDKYIVERAREISRKTGEPFEETLRTLRAPIEAPHYRVLGWIVREDPGCLRGEFGLATGITVNPDLPEKEKKVVIAHEIGHGESICKKLKAGEEVAFGREFERLAWQEGIPAAEELDILDEYLKEYQKEAKYLAYGHHSMWLTLEQRKELEKKYGMVAVRWAEEATKPGDIRAAERAAEYYYGKVKEALGLGHLSPELTEEQIMKLREVLGLPADVAEVLKIHQETGYVP